MLTTILIIILILILLGAFPAWPHSRGWGYGPSGVVGLILVILLILLLLGKICRGLRLTLASLPRAGLGSNSVSTRIGVPGCPAKPGNDKRGCPATRAFAADRVNARGARRTAPAI